MSSRPISLFSYENLVHAFAGAAGSATALGVVYPLDIVRTRLQLQPELVAESTPALVARLARCEGVSSLYRGAAPVLHSLFCSNFVYFYTFHGLKRVVDQRNSTSAGAVFRDLLLAITAGCVNVLVTNPLWVANTRLKLTPRAKTPTSGVRCTGGDEQNVHCSADISPCGGVTASPQPRSLWECLCYVRRTEGYGALYSGVIPSLLLTSNPAIQFVMYESIKRYLQKVHPDAMSHSLVVFLAGAVCKAVATLFTYPLQLIQAHLRFGGFIRADGRKELRILKVFSLIVKRGGVFGLFRGLEAKLLQTVFTAALMFVLYEKIVQLVFRLLLVRGR